MLSIEEIRALGEVHPEMKPIMESGSPMLPGWDMNTDIPFLRDVIAHSKSFNPPVDPATLPCVESDISIPVRDGRNVAARVYKPRQVPDDGCPALIAFHGGGYALGDFDTEAWLCRMFTELGGIAVNVDYRHAPEHVFPAAINDVFDATKWVAENAESLGINPVKGLIVGGESAGADLALCVSALYRDAKLSPPLTGVYSAITSALDADKIPSEYKDRFISMEQNKNAPCLSAESIKFVRSIYKPDFKSTAAFPLANGSPQGMPKTYFQACGLDPVRDCSIILEQLYRDAGVETKLDIYPGLPHGFWMIFPQISVKKKHDDDSRKALEWLLQK